MIGSSRQTLFIASDDVPPRGRGRTDTALLMAARLAEVRNGE